MSVSMLYLCVCVCVCVCVFVVRVDFLSVGRQLMAMSLAGKSLISRRSQQVPVNRSD